MRIRFGGLVIEAERKGLVLIILLVLLLSGLVLYGANFAGNTALKLEKRIESLNFLEDQNPHRLEMVGREAEKIPVLLDDVIIKKTSLDSRRDKERPGESDYGKRQGGLKRNKKRSKVGLRYIFMHKIKYDNFYVQIMIISCKKYDNFM